MKVSAMGKCVDNAGDAYFSTVPATTEKYKYGHEAISQLR